MTTLVTGATGFIGSHVTRQLLDRGDAVRVLVRSPDKLAAVGLDDVKDVARGDLLDPAAIRAALRGVDQVIHIAGYVSTARRDRAVIHQANYDVTVNLLEETARAGVRRVVYLASIFALGGGTQRPVAEDTAYELDGLRIDYFEAKRNAELYAYRARDRGQPIVFAYPCFCYGPGDVYDSSSRLLIQFLRGKLPVFVAGGQNAMDVRDAAAGLIKALDHGRDGAKYILGGENHSYRDLLRILATVTGLSPPRIGLPRGLAERLGRLAERVSKEPPLDEQSAQIAGRWWFYDDARARRELGHTSRPLDHTFDAAVRWLCETGRAPWPKAMVQ
jgi:dihydroflavonol-4-reductase